MKTVLIAGGIVTAAAVGSVFVLTAAVARVLDPLGYCDSGFSRAVDCSYRYMSRSTHQGTPDPAFADPSRPAPEPQPDTSDVTSWSIVDCPRNAVARRVLCAPAKIAEAAGDDRTTGLPRPMPWLVTTAKTSALIEALHVETPLALAETLRFYRAALIKRGWTEDDGAVVAPDRAVIAFTTADGPALLRIFSANDRTNVDLSRRKADARSAAMLPRAGQAMLMLGNATEEAVVFTINEQAVNLKAGADDHLTNDKDSVRTLADQQKFELPPGKYKVTLKTASGAAENREFEIAAGETWGLMAGKDGTPLPVRLY